MYIYTYIYICMRVYVLDSIVNPVRTLRRIGCSLLSQIPASFL